MGSTGMGGPVMSDQSELLRISGLTLRFRGVRALTGVDLAVPRGSISSLIGPNGAGKTSLFNCVSGLYAPDAGEIVYDGQELRGVPPHRIPAVGIMRTYQNVGLFPGLTVEQNILLGAHHRTGYGFLSSLVGARSARRKQAALVSEASEIAEELGLGEYLRAGVGELPYGTQKRVEIARALMGHPRLLMLDEPAGGLSHGEVDQLSQTIQAIRRSRDLTVLLVEHHMGMVMRLSEHVIVMHLGRNICAGEPKTVAADPAVVAAYLGDAA